MALKAWAVDGIRVFSALYAIVQAVAVGGDRNVPLCVAFAVAGVAALTPAFRRAGLLAASLAQAYLVYLASGTSGLSDDVSQFVILIVFLWLYSMERYLRR